MRKVPRHYQGDEITKEVISEIKEIAKKRYDSNIYKRCYEKINNMNDLKKFHGTYNAEDIILGEDWFINYFKTGSLHILEWVALEESSDKLLQTKEMLITLKNLILENGEKYISTCLRHDTSYKIYQKFLDKGFFIEGSSVIFWEGTAPKEAQKWINKILVNYDFFEEYFNDENREIKEEYEKYIIHDISFVPSNKFIKRFGKN